MFSISIASQYLGVSISTLRRWELHGRIAPYRKLGHHRRYSKEQLDEIYGIYENEPPQEIPDSLSVPYFSDTVNP